MRLPSVVPIRTSLLGTIARFAVLAGALSVVAPYFLGLAATLAAIAPVVWLVGRRKDPSAPAPRSIATRRLWTFALPTTVAGWGLALGPTGPWSLACGPALGVACVAFWYAVRPGVRRPEGAP
jgi:hypothetical protein